MRGHRAVLRHSAEVHSGAAIGHHLRRVEVGFLEVGDEPLAHEIALAGRLDRHAGVDEPFQHLEIVADVIAVVVREQHEHRLRVLAGDVLDEARLGGVLRRLRYGESAPARVVPDPGVGVRDLLVVRRGELDDAPAQPAHGDAPPGHARGSPARPGLRSGGASAERQRPAESHHAAQDRAPAQIDPLGIARCVLWTVGLLHLSTSCE
jgi:hypothetical protein